MKETDIIVTNDAWRIAIDIDVRTYHDIISTIRQDLHLVEQNKKEFTSISEIRQIESLLQLLELKLSDFRQVLPRMDSRRGLVNFGGSILKTLFGTATIADISQLHDALNDFQIQNSDITHSLSNQLTYVKKLGTATEINAEAISNLSSIVKDSIIRSHDKFQELTRDLMWLNITVYTQSEIFTTVRQLEFALLRLIQQLDELSSALQSAIQGRLSISLITPNMLLNILKNVSLQLPDGYELIAGIRAANVHLYYELVKVLTAATAHGIKLIVSVPLKGTDHHFTMYKIMTLPEHISPNRFAQYIIDYPYIAIHGNQHDYLLFTEQQYNLCTRGSIVICPTHAAVYDAQASSCEFSLYLQLTQNYQLCQRKLLLHHQSPLLQRHGANWIYHFPEERKITARCSESNKQPTRTLSLHGTGLIHHAASCHFSSSELHSLPELHGTMQTELDAPNFYLPGRVSVITEREAQQLETAIPTDVKRLDSISMQVLAQRQTYDVDNLFQQHRTYR